MPVFLHHSSGGGSRRVFLAVPTYGPVPAIHAFCLFKAHAALLDAGFSVELGLLSGNCHVDDARNRLVREFLAGDCEDFVFIDADVGWQQPDLIRLLGYDRDVVGGTYPMKQSEDDYPARHIPGEIWSDRDGLIEVEGLPTGFLRIRRRVFEKLAADAAVYSVKGGDDDAPAPLIFEREIHNRARMSGDYAFCRKWRATGGKIYLDPDCHLEHAGEKVWAGTYGAHLRRKNGLSLVDGIQRIAAGTEDARSLFALSQEWGNEPWSASAELIKSAVHVVRQLTGPVLETGSGLTTLAMAAANPRITIHALEHSEPWAAKLRESAIRLKLGNIVLHVAPLKATAAGKWYDPPELPWADFQLVLCDGPPRWEGNRKILWSVMQTHGCSPKCILVDDANTEGESIPAPYRTEIKGQLRKFAVGLRNG